MSPCSFAQSSSCLERYIHVYLTTNVVVAHTVALKSSKPTDQCLNCTTHNPPQATQVFLLDVHIRHAVSKDMDIAGIKERINVNV